MGGDMTIRVVAGSLMGVLVGSFLYRFAKRSAQERLGRIGLVSCIVAGAFFGLALAGPIGLVFYFVIRSRTPRVAGAQR
jgi:hypothetical protein